MLEAGQTVGRYLVESTLGRGAMGTVYRAKDTTLRREVAVKVLEPGDAGGGLDPEAHARFLREARAAAALHHPNIVAVYDVGEHDGQPFLAMELVIGNTLRNILASIIDGDEESESISIPMRIRWLVEVARGLAEAHTHNLVHRDVKPENVLVSTEGQAKLTDFGIVKQRQRESNPAPQSFRTKTGQLVGTPDYMAPEQWASADVDARADQYAWGLVAYELLTERPLPLGRPQPIQNIAPSIADKVAACITRAIEHHRDSRYPSMDEIITELEPFCAQSVTQAALTRSMPPPTTSNAEAIKIGIAPTLDVRSGLAPNVVPTLKSAEDPAAAAAHKASVEDTKRRDKYRLASSSSSKRSSSGRTFAIAVIVTLAIAIVVIIIALVFWTKTFG